MLKKLLQVLAVQMGNEVNYNELSQTVGANKITVQKYIEILERAYIPFRLNSFNRNSRTEIKQNIFFDNRIRNIILGNYSPLG